MRAVLCVVACLLTISCDVPSPPKLSPYRFMTPECIEVRFESCSLFIHP
jgi:hypothetical protein